MPMRNWFIGMLTTIWSDSRKPGRFWKITTPVGKAKIKAVDEMGRSAAVSIETVPVD